jgi:hypothetical protein
MGGHGAFAEFSGAIVRLPWNGVRAGFLPLQFFVLKQLMLCRFQNLHDD